MQKMAILTDLAWSMHNDRQREIGQSMLVQTVASSLREYDVAVSDGYVLELLEHLESRSGLIISRGTSASGDRIYSFSHLSFQEYLAARPLRAMTEEARLAFIHERHDDSWWREPLLLLVAQLERPNAVVERLYVESFSPPSVNLLLFAGACLAETQLVYKDDLFGRIAADLVFMASGTSVKAIDPSRLVADRYNLFLRFLVAFLTEVQSRFPLALRCLLEDRAKRSDRGLAMDLVSELSKANSIGPFETRLLLHFQLVDNSRAVKALLSSTSESTLLSIKQPIAITQKWLDEVFRWEHLPALAAVSRIAKFDDMPNARRNRRATSWHEETLDYLTRRLVSGRGSDSIEGQNNEVSSDEYFEFPAESEFIVSVGGSPRQLVSEHVAAAAVEQYGASRTEPDRSRCVIKLLNRDSVDHKISSVMIHYVTKWIDDMITYRKQHSTRSTRTNAVLITDSNPFSREKALSDRCFGRLGDSIDGSPSDLRFLFRCLASGDPEAKIFADVAIERIVSLEDVSVLHCIEVIERKDFPSSGAALKLLAAAPRGNERAIEVALSAMYDRENSYLGRPVREVAGSSLMHLISLEP